MSLELAPVERAVLLALVVLQKEKPGLPVKPSLAQLQVMVGGRRGGSHADDMAVTDAAKALEGKGLLERQGRRWRVLYPWITADAAGFVQPEAYPEFAWRGAARAAAFFTQLEDKHPGPWALDVFCRLAVLADSQGQWNGTQKELAELGIARDALRPGRGLSKLALVAGALDLQVSEGRPKVYHLQLGAPTIQRTPVTSPIRQPTSIPANRSERGSRAAELYPLDERGQELAFELIPSSLQALLVDVLEEWQERHGETDVAWRMEHLIWPVARACKNHGATGAGAAALKEALWGLCERVHSEERQGALRSPGGWFTRKVERAINDRRDLVALV